ncbi:endonuclease/exonuclease/phosphatase family protein, partial [Streptomyces sp. OF1]|nr:endonuclease/exonuclease/phosphatase family protein [Streptomyces alkaliterrae]
MLLLVCTAPLVARISDADGPTPLPQLLAFLPWLLVPGWLALFFAVLARRLLLVGWALAALGTIAWYLQPYGPSQT